MVDLMLKSGGKYTVRPMDSHGNLQRRRLEKFLEKVQREPLTLDTKISKMRLDDPNDPMVSVRF